MCEHNWPKLIDAARLYRKPMKLTDVCVCQLGAGCRSRRYRVPVLWLRNCWRRGLVAMSGGDAADAKRSRSRWQLVDCSASCSPKFDHLHSFWSRSLQLYRELANNRTGCCAGGTPLKTFFCCQSQVSCYIKLMGLFIVRYPSVRLR